MSLLEERLALQFKAVKLTPAREWAFHPRRRWRFDFAFPNHKLAVEVEGGIWNGGAHTRGKHFQSDCEKYNAACELGWSVLRYTEREIRDGSALAQIERMLGHDQTAAALRVRQPRDDQGPLRAV